jgi:hypothetical protein
MDVTRAMMYPARSREKLATFGHEYRGWTRSGADDPLSLGHAENQTKLAKKVARSRPSLCRKNFALIVPAGAALPPARPADGIGVAMVLLIEI